MKKCYIFTYWCDFQAHATYAQQTCQVILIPSDCWGRSEVSRCNLEWNSFSWNRKESGQLYPKLGGNLVQYLWPTVAARRKPSLQLSLPLGDLMQFASLLMPTFNLCNVCGNQNVRDFWWMNARRRKYFNESLS